MEKIENLSTSFTGKGFTVHAYLTPLLRQTIAQLPYIVLLLLIAMAWRMRSKLPAFNVTQRSKAGVVRRSVPRGRKDDDNAAACTGNRFSGVEEEDASDPRPDFSFTATFEPSGAITGETSGQPDVSLHAIKHKASTAAWG